MYKIGVTTLRSDEVGLRRYLDMRVPGFSPPTPVEVAEAGRPAWRAIRDRNRKPPTAEVGAQPGAKQLDQPTEVDQMMVVCEVCGAHHHIAERCPG